MKIIKKNNENSLILELVNQLKKDIKKKREKNKRFSFVLTGGKSPINLYKKLAKSNIDWINVDLFWGDERHVSKRSKNSNFKLAYDNLIKKIKINKKNLYPINTTKNINTSSKEYTKSILKYFKKEKIFFDYFLLGMGNDGHIASIFPESIELKKKFISRPVIRKDFKRITLSLNVINKSKKIILWLNNKIIVKKFTELKKRGKKIPVNNINKRKIFIYKII